VYWRRYKISMFRKLLIVFTVALLAAVFILPASAQFFGSPFGGFGPFGFPFGFSPFGTSFSSGFTTASTFSSGFTSVNGFASPFFGGFGPFCGTGFGGFGPFGGCGLGGLGFGGLGGCF
jgi:hypothetical protein